MADTEEGKAPTGSPNVANHTYLTPLYGGITRDRGCSSLQPILGNPRPDTILSEQLVCIVPFLLVLASYLISHYSC